MGFNGAFNTQSRAYHAIRSTQGEINENYKKSAVKKVQKPRPSLFFYAS